MGFVIIGNDKDRHEDDIDIFDTLNNDKKNFIANGDKNGLSACRVILGEIQRDPSKDYSNKNITKILRTLRSVTMKNPEVDFLLVELINTYIPAPISDADVELWLWDHYNIEEIQAMGKNAFKIIGETKRHFKDKDFNATIIKDIITKLVG